MCMRMADMRSQSARCAAGRGRTERGRKHHILNAIMIENMVFTPRRAGGCLNTPLSGFSPIAGKRRRSAPPFLAQLFIHLFRTLCENFRPRSLKVRSPGHVK